LYVVQNFLFFSLPRIPFNKSFHPNDVFSRVVREESLKASESVRAALEDSKKIMADLGQK